MPKGGVQVYPKVSFFEILESLFDILSWIFVRIIFNMCVITACKYFFYKSEKLFLHELSKNMGYICTDSHISQTLIFCV